MPQTIIGVDCATDPEKTGLCLSFFEEKLTIAEAHPGKSHEQVRETLAGWASTHTPALICLDAPLGWPEAMARELGMHTAGTALHTDINRMFSRETDRFIHRVLGKKPLEVGANFIARTAHAALALLENLREDTGQNISLGWSPEESGFTCALETYPAATLLVRDLRLPGYRNDKKIRGDILEKLSAEVVLEPGVDQEALIANDHVFDSMVCCLAGADFAQGLCLPPENMIQACKEGWIWVRPLN